MRNEEEKEILDPTEESVEESKDTTEEEVIEETIREEIPLEEQNKILMADMENLRKRFEEEKMQFIKYRSSNFLSEILPTLDMFEMALNAKVSDEIKTWLTGFQMVYANLMTALENEGVKKIETKIGDTFNHEIHFGAEEIETEEVEAGKIAKLVLSGYKLHDRLLRPATVAVAKDKNEKEIKGE